MAPGPTTETIGKKSGTTRKGARAKKAPPFHYREVDVAAMPPGSVPYGLSPDEMIVDLFCGAGGASYGILGATGRHPDVAVNHNPAAIAVHEANHRATRHFQTDVWETNPLAATSNGSRRVGLLWASPDCRSHSRAKGGKPKSKGIRDLAWVVVRWAKAVRPRIILLENVPEFEAWGPLLPSRLPNKEAAGSIFALFVSKLERLGYRVEYKMISAADHGTPTIRKRLFMVARCDGFPIVWPAATHGDPATQAVKDGLRKPWRTASEIIDWDIPCHSIFLSKDQGRAVGVKRPLADNTLMRIARGIQKYVIEVERPFIVSLTHQGGDRNESLDRPLNVVTGANRGEKALCDVERTAFLAKFRFDSSGAPLDAPLPTVTANSYEKRPGGATPLGLVTADTAARGEAIAPIAMPYYGTGVCASLEGPIHTITAEDRHALVAPVLAEAMLAEARSANAERQPSHSAFSPTLASLAHGDSGGRRTYPLDEPIGTQTGTNAHALVAPVVTYAQQGGGNRPADAPIHTITASGKDQNGLLVAELSGCLVPRYGERDGQAPRAASLEAPLATVVATSNQGSLVCANIVRHYGRSVGSGLDEPIGTATAGGGGKSGLVVTETAKAVDDAGTEGRAMAAYMAQQNGGMVGHGLDEPLSTIVGKGSTQTPVVAHLTRFNQNGLGSALNEPLDTVMAGATRHAMVAAHMLNMKGSDQRASAADAPMPTATSQGNHIGAVCGDLVGANAYNLRPDEYRRALKVARFLRERGCWNGGEVVMLKDNSILSDIRLRMLSGYELARGQGFGSTYVLDAMVKGKPITATTRVSLVGNSVCPQVSRDLAHANCNLAVLLDLSTQYKAWGEALKAKILAKRGAAQSTNPATTLPLAA